MKKYSIKNILNLDLFFNIIFKKTEKINIEKLYKIIKNRRFFNEKEKILSIFPYSNSTIRKMIIDLKFNNKKENAKIFGKILYEILPDFLIDWELKYNFHKPIIITVPVPFLRKIKRGYNQNDLIIENFQNNGGKNFINWEKKIVLKKYRKPQTKTKNKIERLKNQKNAFKITKPKKIKNQNIIIFDDIYTTGATINELKKELKKNGAKNIITIILAH